MIAGLIQLLKDNSDVSAIVADRVYDSVLSYGRGWEYPAVAIRQESGAQEYDLAGPVDGREDDFEISSYADTAEQADILRETIRNAIKGYSGTLTDGTVVSLIAVDRPSDLPFTTKTNPSGSASRKTLDIKVYRL